ncbi:MAG TPA: histidine kinase [Mobilitalea sp.]|nr:histidine kinase [Mobilitalea sp.]
MKKYDFSNIIKFIEITLTIMVLLNFSVAFYAIYQLTHSSMDAVTSRLSTDVENISRTLSGIHSMMLSEVGYDRDLDTLLVADNAKTLINKINITGRIKGLITNWSKDLPYPVNYVLYFPGNGKIINDADNYAEYVQWITVEKDIITNLNNHDYKAKWNIVELGDAYYLVDIIYNNGRYMLAYISLKDVVDSIQSDFYGKNYYISVTDDSDNAYFNEEQLVNDNITASQETTGILRKSLLKQLLVVKENVKEGINFIMVIHNYNDVLKTFWIQLFLVLVMIGIVIVVLFILRFINNTILRPIQTFNKNVETLKNDEVYDVATHYQINELGNASTLMSEMVERIKGLKISIYEKTLEQQKTKMDFLTLQIEPHFYLNCLNIIYNMAQMEQYKEIQRLSNCVSEYLRYIFKSRDSYATVREELEHIKKYLEIQKIRYGNCFEAHITLDDRLLDMKLPPLVLQTFVENSLKYTINWEDDIELFITGRIEEEAVINIEDTGEGYESEILYKLQNGIDISEGEKRIGIMNAVSRMKLTYGNAASIRFYNRAEGGAGVEIRFPITQN